jgi:hypothetical protein
MTVGVAIIGAALGLNALGVKQYRIAAKAYNAASLAGRQDYDMSIIARSNSRWSRTATIILI